MLVTLPEAKPDPGVVPRPPAKVRCMEAMATRPLTSCHAMPCMGDGCRWPCCCPSCLPSTSPIKSSY